MDGCSNLGGATMTLERVEMGFGYHAQQQFPHFPSNDGGGVAPAREENEQEGQLTTTIPFGKQKLMASPEQVEDNEDDAKQQASSAAAVAPVTAWHRMKWTDAMVRLLIMIVYSIGGDQDNNNNTHVNSGSTLAAETPVGGCKRACGSGIGGCQNQSHHQQQQKKGKWKSVSQAMMERGYCVSPQQCEDKFNDLNKRYKRVNELLGRGTACRVVENHALLDSLDHLTPKGKEEARKLLNSKHLFFREMCAYHNTPSSVSSAATTSTLLFPWAAAHEPQQLCVHHQPDFQYQPATDQESALVEMKMKTKMKSSLALHDEDEDEYHQFTDGDDEEDSDHEDEYKDDSDDPQDEEEGKDDVRQYRHNAMVTPDEVRRKRARFRERYCLPLSTSSSSPPLTLSLSSAEPLQHELHDQLMGLTERTEQQQRQWLRQQASELEQQQLRFRCKALDLERQRFKWLRFSANKEREMERLKLDNERRLLHSQRMLLLLRDKELNVLASANSASSAPNCS